MRSSFALVFALLAAVGSTACRRSAAREWRPEDHDEELASGGQQAPDPDANAATNDERALVEAAWANNCVLCHGRMGQGDGPQGPMVKAPNLTDPALVDKLSDAELAALIKNDKNKMPAFPAIPDRVVAGLVQRIRALEAKP